MKLTGHHNIRGPEYNDNSCAFDTQSMELSQIYQYMNNNEKAMFCQGLPVLGAIYKELHRVLTSSLGDTSSQINGLRAAKDKIKALYFYEGSIWKFNQLTSMDLLIEEVIKKGGPRLRNSGQVLSYEELEQQGVARANMMVLKYRSAGSCQKPECLQIKENSEAIKISTIHRVINMSLLIQLNYNSVQEGINHVFKQSREGYRCQNCNDSETREYEDVEHPFLFHLSIPTSFLGTVSTELSILGKEYLLFSVEYGNMSHYKCRFLRENKVYEYDGMKPNGGFFLVTSEPSFPPMIADLYRACGIWYIRID